MKKLLLILLLFFLFSCTQNLENKEEVKTYINNIDFFTQAPFESKKSWLLNESSCEEASILLYTSFLELKKYNKNSFNNELIKMKKYQVDKYGKEEDLKKYKLRDFINDYFNLLQANVALNLNKQKITWLLGENKPIIIGINSSDIDNPYYNYAGYHTLLIVGETKYDYIVKDVGTKKGNDWKYPKDEIMKAIKNNGKWGIIIRKVENENINTDKIKEDKSYNYSTFQSKSYYNDLIFDKHDGISLDLPKDVGGGIIAHHLTVGPYFDNYFRVLKETRPNIKTFILGGTNHFNFDNKIYTTNHGYKTPFGILSIDTNLQNKINSLEVNNKVLFNEHSIHSEVGFIKKYYPNAKLLPFIINENISINKLNILEKELFKLYNKKDYFYIQSSDFTHFQPQYVTNFHDLYSKNILDDFDITRVDSMMVDCRTLQYFTFELLEDLGYKKHYNLINSSSNNFFGIENFSNTSHFFSYFGKGENLKKSDQVSLLFTGDMMLNYDLPKRLDITVNGRIRNRAYPFDGIDSFEETFFRSFDEIIINSEGNFGKNTYEKDIKGGPIYFKYDEKWLNMIKNVLKAKILFFSNNHLRDFGNKGIEETKRIIEKHGLKFVGNATGFFPNKNIYKRKIGNKELIVININDVITPLFDYDLELLKKYIAKNKKENSIIVIYIHWGREYQLKANKRQIELGHKFIDYGADLVVGNHTHTIENKENYKGKMIYYTLGNLTYDSSRMKAYIPQVKYGIFLGVNFNNKGTYFFEMPYKIVNRRPVMLLGKEKEKVLEYLN